MLLPILIAAVAAGAILLIVIGLAGGSPVDPVQARLTQLGSMQAKNLEELELQQPFIERTLRPLAARLSGARGAGSRARRSASAPRSASRSPATRATCASATGSASRPSAPSSAAIMFFLLFVVVGVIKLPFLIAILMTIVGVLFGYTVPEFWLGRRVKKRQKAILLMIPDALDLLTISVRAGLGFDAALGKVVEKLKGPLSDEFRRALAEVRVGKARRDALRDIVPRTEVAPLTNFIGAIIQAEQLGVSISKVLQVQSEQLRIERRQRAEEQAAKAPIKMLFPLVGCIFPSLFIVILGPAIILIVQNLAVWISDRIGLTARDRARNLRGPRCWPPGSRSPSGLWARFMGLMGAPSLGPVRGLWLPDSERDPHDVHALRRSTRCSSASPIPSADGARPVVSVHRALRRWTGLVPLVRGAHGVLELPVGTIDAHRHAGGRPSSRSAVSPRP